MADVIAKLEAVLTAAALGEEGEVGAARSILAEAGIGQPRLRAPWRPRPAQRSVP